MSGGAPEQTTDVAPAPPEKHTQEPNAAAPPAPVAAATAPPEPIPAAGCANCAAPQTGLYCAQCGQKHADPIHSVWHFVAEATEGLTHADSRLWQTLIALLARPGALTREFLDGHRVRYLPPLRLYLVISLLYFLVQTFSLPPPVVDVDISPGGLSKGFHIGPPKSSGVPMTPELASQMCRTSLTQLHATLPGLSRLPHLEQSLFDSCRKNNLDGGRSFDEAMLRTSERELFLFFPLLALFAGALYRRPRHHFVEHLLFFVHNQSFLLLVFGVFDLVVLATPAALTSVTGVLGFVVFAYSVWYLYRALRRVYGQGRLLTLAKYAALALFYFVTYVVGMTIAAVYSFVTL